MAGTLFGALTRATNLLSRQLEERTTELGIRSVEYLVLRAASMYPGASTSEIRRSLGLRDAAFSDVVRRTVYRGFVVQERFPGDGRTRRLALTFPGSVACGITAGIHAELEAEIGVGPWMEETIDRVDTVGRRLLGIPPVELYLDGLPVDTA
ncbi:MAG TPA: MarR family winged helix-turn-helix transcriptional regulator [Candidatus Limnocylindrales bacterium]|jgi:DNA-binding MarR family transcriptional regulator